MLCQILPRELSKCNLETQLKTTVNYAHWGEALPLQICMSNHWSKWNSEEPYAHPQWREVAQSVKSQTRKVVIHAGEKPIQLPDPNQEHALRHR